MATYNYHLSKVKEITDRHLCEQGANCGMYQNEANLDQIHYIDTGKRRSKRGEVAITGYVKTCD